jgi:hypothetical protein
MSDESVPRVRISRRWIVGNGIERDVARQAANVVGALFQAGMTTIASAKIQGVVDEGPRSLVEPALYTFAIWGLIFVLSLAYAAFQALPANRGNPLLRRGGWFTAAAFFCTGLWSVFVPLRWFGLAQLMLLGIFAFLLIAYLRLSRYARERSLTRGERWLVALPLGPFLGWVTLANAVSLTAEAVRRGLVAPGGAGEAALGTALLLVGTLLACAVILVGRKGPVQGYLSYGATVLWALTGIVVNQYAYSPVTTGAALLAAVLVAVVLFGALRDGRPGGDAHRSARPGTA